LVAVLFEYVLFVPYHFAFCLFLQVPASLHGAADLRLRATRFPVFWLSL